jgi:ribonucleotide reductase alpha subunit
VEEVEGKKEFNFEKLGEIVKIAVNNLNKIINVNFYPVIETQLSNFRHRPIGLGVQGLACCYAKMGFPFDSEDAIKLNKMIFECIYYHALLKSNELAKELGAYETFKGSPFSEGKLQFHLAGLNENDMSKELGYNWSTLISDIKEFGTRNSLLTTIMPTASTAQIMNNNESIEPFASNIYVRKTIAGDFIIVNKYLIEDLKKIDKWTDEIYQELVFDNGSVQKLDIPNELKEKYKTAYEIKQSVLLKQSVDRGIFIDQSQSLNIFMAKPDFNKLHSCHMYSWKNGLKTGMYYLRSQPVSEGIKFGIDSEVIKNIKNKRNIDEFKNEETVAMKNANYNEVCETCSA